MQKPVLEVNSAAAMTGDEHQALLDLIETHGFVHLVGRQVPVDPVHSILSLAHHFGKPVFHKLSDQHGIHPIRYIPGYPEYANANVEELGLHTDGSFEANPPAFMLIHCERASGEGGETTLASGDALYSHLAHEHPGYLRALSLPAAFTIWRDDRMAERSVFSPMGERLRLAYRSGSDVKIEVRPEAHAAFEHVRDWLRDPANYFKFRLQPGETLVFDNMRVLHGRTAFSRDSNRSLYGLWCDGEGAAVRCGIDPQRLNQMEFETRQPGGRRASCRRP